MILFNGEWRGQNKCHYLAAVNCNISLMFLFPWFDWGDDISDFEKIDFLAHGRFWGVPSPWAG